MPYSYVFDAGVPVGKKYQSEDDFCFPLQTTIPFDYCFREDTQENILKSFDNPSVVGVLSDKEYVDLIYADCRLNVATLGCDGCYIVPRVNVDFTVPCFLSIID